MRFFADAQNDYRKRILFIIYSYPPEVIAGWQNFTKELAEEFAYSGHKVTVIVSRSGFKASKCHSAKVKVIRIPALKIPFIRYLFELFATLTLSFLEFPDIIFGMSLSPGGIISSALGKFLKAKSFIYLIGREMIKECGMKESNLWRNFVGNIFLRLSNKVICATEFVKNNLPKSKAINNKSIICPLFINIESLTSCKEISEFRIQNSEFIILYVGRIIEEKGLDLLIKAMAILKISSSKFQVQGPKPKIFLRVIGTGNKKEEYKELAKKLLDKNDYEFLGFVQKERLSEYFLSADLLVLPSRSETFGLVLLEANYFGLPVIATHVWGIPYVVKDKINGILVEPTPESIADGIKMLLNDKELYEKIKQNAQGYALQFSKERVFKQLLNKCRIKE